MNNGKQQAWQQFWDGTGASADPLAAIDCPEISWRTYKAVCFCIQKLMALSAEDIVLNIGCGPGLFEEQLSSSVKRTVGLDFSRVMVEKAQKRNANLQNASFLQATGTALPFARPQFNKVLCYSILHYFSENEVRLLLREIRRVTCSGSRILLGDIEGEPGIATPVSINRALEIWTGAGVGALIDRGTCRVRNEVRRRVTRIQRKWMVFSGRYVFASKPQRLAQYSRHRLLALAAAEGFRGEIIEQGGERFVGGRYHALLHVS